ncbi:MAG: peptidogalycan biosysnthesis protein [Thermomonas sp.]
MPFVSQVEPEALVRHFLAHPPRDFTAERLASGVTAFTAPFDILTTAEPELRRQVSHWPWYRHWCRWLRPQSRFIGSTVTEYAWLPENVQAATLAPMLRDTQSSECPLLIVKDIPQQSPLLHPSSNAWCDAFAEACSRAGFVLLQGQALAWLPIDFASTDDYLSRLSKSRRRNIRRKLRSRAALDLESVATGNAFTDDAVIDACYALYCNVYAQSEIHFDLLERSFFNALLRDADSGGIVFIYRHGGRMIGWNLCFEHGGMLVDKYMGLAYPEAREHNLYAVSWMENLDYARRQGLRYYVAGWTDPEVKAELGARFTFTRHAVYPRNRLLRWLLRRIAGRFEGDRAWHEGND